MNIDSQNDQDAAIQTFMDARMIDNIEGHMTVPDFVDPADSPPIITTPEMEISHWAGLADSIAVVKCVNATYSAVEEPPYVTTTFTLVKISSLRGNPPSTVEQPGGVLEDRIVLTSDLPSLVAGRSYVAFFYNSTQLIFTAAMIDTTHAWVTSKSLDIDSITMISDQNPVKAQQ